MKIVIVPSHNQSSHIKNIIDGYEKQTVKIDLLLFVLDRCSDDSEEVLKSIISTIVVMYVKKESGLNFSAGMTRDFGLECIKSLDYSMVLFTDGDCVPSKKVVEEHYTNISNTSKALVSIGKRISQDENGEWKDDERNIGFWVNGTNFNKLGRILHSHQFTTKNVMTYSCNLAFNKKAIELCKYINKTISNSDRVFNPEFDGSWGGEDDFISHCLFLTSNWIVMCSNESFVKHYYHKEEKKDLSTKIEKISKLSSLIKKNIFEGKIEGEYKTFKKNILVSAPSLDLDYYSDIVESNILTKYESKLFNAYFTLATTRLYKFEGYENIRYVKNKEIPQYIDFMKFYLRNDTMVYEDDSQDFNYKDLFLYNILNN